MPELPEVENVVLSLKPHVTKSRINDISVTKKGERALGKLKPTDLKELLRDNSIYRISRRGKFIIFQLSEKDQNPKGFVIGHLRMTGRFVFQSNQILDPKEKLNLAYIRFTIFLENGNLYFADQRRFGTFHFVNSLEEYPGLQKLGVEALSDELNVDYLQKKFKKRHKPIYSALMDQSIIAGLGNIYVCESLVRAKLHPLTPAKSISANKLKELILHIKTVLENAIIGKGTSFRDYLDGEGRKGNFQHKLLVYGKKTAHIDGKTYDIAKMKIGGRTVHYIPELQKL
jgi:formamidopyrimidine-DNA glycosylase